MWGLGLNGWLGGWEGKGGTKPDSTGNGALAERVFALKVTHVLVLGGGGLGNRQKARPLSFCEHKSLFNLHFPMLESAINSLKTKVGKD